MRHQPAATGFGRAPGKPRHSGRSGISPALFYTVFAILLGLNVATLVAFFMSPDIARLVSGQNKALIGAYEQRIAQLRVEVDRLHSRQYAQAGDMNLQLQELSVQQELLTEQHQYVKALAAKAAELGLATAQVPAADAAPLAARPGAADDLAATSAAIDQMMDESRAALTAISTAASASTEKIVGELSRLGIDADLPADAAIGGPLLPARDDLPDATDMLDEANATMAALIRFKAARGALASAPVHMPVAGDPRLSSGFGNRKDPFTRGRAFHAGLDFAKPTGTVVLAAGAGKIVFVGQRSGYGNVVEIDHGNGVLTRYAHLSGFIAEKGQAVVTGTPIALVGSTGRSTGPHLHFEVRRADQPLDPIPFLNAGKRLLAALS